MTFFRPRTLALQLLALALLALGAPAAGAADPYQLQPDTATLKSSWKEFFSDPVYLNLSSETRKGIADRLFTELIENDTAYAELAEPLRGEARAFFYARAGVPPPVPADAAGPGPGAETSPLEVKAATSPVIAAPPAAQAAVPEAPAKKLPPQPLGQSWFEPVPPQGPLSQLEIIEYAALKAQEALYPPEVRKLLSLDRRKRIQDALDEDFVHIVYRGDYYHRRHCPVLGRAGDRGSFSIPLGKARLAYFPCHICLPPP